VFLEWRGGVELFVSGTASVVIVLFKLMGVLMMILRKTEHIWRVLIRNCVLNSLYVGFNTEDSTKI
jgi:hypothetical protein